MIHRFSSSNFECKKNKLDSCNGWILKTPFSHNQQNKLLIRSSKNITSSIFSLQDALSNTKEKKRRMPRGIPYMMMQPTVVNLKEYKLVLFNGKFCHVCNSRSSHNHGFPYSEQNETNMFKFAEDALRFCFAQCPYMIVDGLVRVDIFEAQDGRLVVNK